MKELIFLKTLDVFSFVFKWTGFNYSVMRMVVQLKIINDKRRAPTILSNANRKKDLDNNQFYTSLLFYLFYGLILLIIFFSPGPLFFRMALSLGAMILLLITIMISDYSSVLLDIKDRNILLPKPVDSRVLNIAKIIHIFYYLSMISLTLSGPTLIAGFATNGVIFLFIFVPVLIMILFLCIFVTSLLYGLILRFLMERN